MSSNSLFPFQLYYFYKFYLVLFIFVFLLLVSSLSFHLLNIHTLIYFTVFLDYSNSSNCYKVLILLVYQIHHLSLITMSVRSQQFFPTGIHLQLGILFLPGVSSILCFFELLPQAVSLFASTGYAKVFFGPESHHCYFST